MNDDVYDANRKRILSHFCSEAKKSGYWIYESGYKKWWTPEEFEAHFSRSDIHLSEGWLEDYKIMNPLRGLTAADTIVQQITEKKAQLQQKIVEYFQNKLK